MTRTQQTWSIIGAIVAAVVILIAAYTVLENKREFEKRYPGCWQLIGEDTACQAHHAANRLMGRPPVPYGMENPYSDLTTEPIVVNDIGAEDAAGRFNEDIEKEY